MIRSKNRSWLAVGVVALVGSMTGFAHAASPAGADEAAIRAESTSWVKAYNGGDAKAVAALYAKDALLRGRLNGRERCRYGSLRRLSSRRRRAPGRECRTKDPVLRVRLAGVAQRGEAFAQISLRI